MPALLQCASVSLGLMDCPARHGAVPSACGEMAESAEGARLLSEYGGISSHRGFESLSLRHLTTTLPIGSIARPRTSSRRISGRKRGHAPLAQLDRASDYESEGHRFESCGARHHNRKPRGTRCGALLVATLGRRRLRALIATPALGTISYREPTHDGRGDWVEDHHRRHGRQCRGLRHPAGRSGDSAD